MNDKEIIVKCLEQLVENQKIILKFLNPIPTLQSTNLDSSIPRYLTTEIQCSHEKMLKNIQDLPNSQ